MANVYRPPQGNTERFCATLHDSLGEATSRGNAEIFLIRDLNVDFLNKSSSDVKDVLCMAGSFGLKPLVRDITRFSTTNSCLDQIFTNSDSISNSGVLNYSVSDHLGVFVSRKKRPESNAKINFEGRSYRNYEREDFQARLIDAKWDDFYEEGDPDKCWETMSNIIKHEINKTCPLKSFKVKSGVDPWITNELLEEIRDKDLMIKRARRTKLQADWVVAKLARNRVGRQIEVARVNYFREEHLASTGDPKRFWGNIASVIPSNKSHQTIDSLIDQSNNKVKQEEAAGFINDFFANIGPNLAKGNTEPWSFMGQVNQEVLNDVHTDYEEVYKLCKEINVTKSAGLQNMSTKFLKDAFIVLVPQLVYLFNLSLAKGIIPDTWKIARVVPLFKGGAKTDVGNFRSISLLPLPGKLLERIVHSRVSSFFETCDLLCGGQGGFRKGHSTTLSVADLTDNIFQNINENRVTLAVFIDLKKAFDTIDHPILIKKLEFMGIKGSLLNWFSDYLHNRSQLTIANGITSDTAPIVCGVPQGSILGPLLFISYINDAMATVKNSSIQFYADDTVIYASGVDSAKASLEIQPDLTKFYKWCKANILTLNKKKTKLMVFGTRSKIKKSQNVCIKIDGEKL